MELVERYVHQVGQYLPPKERADIEAELRSQIEDRLFDRYGDSPTQAEITSVLTEMGYPYQIATSYTDEKYLVGPGLYPFLITVLRYGWVIVPSIVIFLNVFGILISSEPNTITNLLIQPVFTALQFTLIFSAVVVFLFALVERKGIEHEDPFDPSELSKVDDPGNVDRFETVFGIAFGILVTLVLLFYVQVGGLTLRFDLSDPGEVIPVPIFWMVLLIISGLITLVIHVIVLRRNYWSIGLWLTETLLEVFGAICLYFVLYEPILQRIFQDNPSLAETPIIHSIPEAITIIFAVLTLLNRGTQLVKLWNYRHDNESPSLNMQPNKQA